MESPATQVVATVSVFLTVGICVQPVVVLRSGRQMRGKPKGLGWNSTNGGDLLSCLKIQIPSSRDASLVLAMRSRDSETPLTA